MNRLDKNDINGKNTCGKKKVSNDQTKQTITWREPILNKQEERPTKV